MNGIRGPEDLIQPLREFTERQIKLPDDRTEEYHNALKADIDAITYLTEDRGISVEAIDHFRLGLDPRRMIAIPIMKAGKLIDYKFRSTPPADKQYIRVAGTESYIFNDAALEQAKIDKEIFIVEGEIDAMTMWTHGFKNVISSSSGVQFVGSWINDLDDVDRIYICLDSDEPGQAATKKLMVRLGPERCATLALPTNDINDYFKEHTAEDFNKVIKAAKFEALTGVFQIAEFVDEARKHGDDKDLKFGYPLLDGPADGYNRGEVIMVTGLTSVHKTTFASNLIINAIKQDAPTLFIPLEGDIRYIAKRLLSIHQGSPPQYWEDDEWEQVKQDLIDTPLYLYVGDEKDFTLDMLRSIMLTAKKVYGVEVIVLDHIHYFANRSASNPNDEIGNVIRDINRMAKTMGVAIFVVAHVTKPMKEKGRDSLDLPPNMADMRGSSFLMQDPDKVIVVHQSFKDKAQGVIRIKMDKNRYGPIIPTRNFVVNYDTGRITEAEQNHGEESK